MSAYFSIVVPAYNRAHVLPRAVDSVIAQRFTDWELLVVDDGSTDNTAEVMKRYTGDQRVKYIYQQNAERSAARNKGILLAQGKYVCFLDSDDAYLDNHLSEVYDELQRQDQPVAMLRTFAKVMQGTVAREQPFVGLGDVHPVSYLLSNTVYPCNVIIHRLLLETERFNEGFSYAEDTDLWCRILLKAPLVVLCRLTTVYYISPGNSSSSVGASVHEKYIRTLESIFSNPEIRRLVAPDLIKMYFWKRYFWMTHEFIKNGERQAAKAAFRKMLSCGVRLFSRDTVSTWLKITRM